MKLPPQINTVLFDMDGVLIDSSTAVEESYGHWAEENGFDRQAVLNFVHGRRTVEVVTEFGDFPDSELEADRLEAVIAAGARQGEGIAPGCELFRSLNSDRIALVTSARRATAEGNLQALRLELPKVVVTGQDVADGKPSPEPYLRAADLLGVDPGECVVIEDSPAGISAGKAAGCHVVGLVTTHDPTDLGEADLVLAPSQIAAVFESLLIH